MIWLKKILSKITIKNQLFILLLIIFIIVSLFMGSLFYLNSFLAQRLVNEISQRTYSSLNIRQLSIQAYFFHKQLNQVFLEKTHILNCMSDTYQFLQLRNSLVMDQRLSISLISINDTTANVLSTLPYFFSTTSINSDEETDASVPKLSQILNFLLFNLANFKQNQMIILASSDSNQFVAVNPFTNLNVTNIYNVHGTSWYKNHIKQISSNSDINYVKYGPDKEFTDNAQMIVSKSLFGTLSNFDGIMGITNNIFNLELFDNYDYITILILNKEGRIISSNRKSMLQNSQFQVFIYNTSIIGFDENDWEQIKKQVSNNTGESNCKQNTIGFCRYNTLLQQDFNIVSYFDEDDHYFICIKSSRELQMIQNSINQIIDQLKLDLIRLIRLFWIGGILIIIPIYIFMKIFFSPFKQIEIALSSQLNPDTKIYFLKTQQNSKDVFEKLGFGNFYKQIQHRRTKKTTQCFDLEAFTFPKQVKNGNKNQQKLFKNMKIKLKNLINEQCIYNDSQKLMKSIFINKGIQ